MNISRNFLLTGSLYLVAGILLGSYMGASEDHTLIPVHAHINLLGFTLMTVFGLSYRIIPSLDQGMLPKVQFWLHQVGSLGLLAGLTLMMTNTVSGGTIGPLFPVFEGAILVGAILWVILIFRRS